jgi:hypothetical protein
VGWVAFPKVAARRKPTEKGAQAMQSKTSTTSGSVNDFHVQAEFTFLLEQVWLDTEEGTA